jgi:lipopolysaccharide transport system permease protein
MSKISFEKKPLFRITPKKKWFDLELKEIMERRGLLWLLTLKNIRLKYRQTLLGVLWTVVQPIAPMLVFSLVFNKYFAASSGKFSYPVFVYAGLIPWIYFSNAVNWGGNSLASQSYLLGKVYFPRFMLPLSVVFAGIPDFLIGCFVLSGVMIFSGMTFSLTLLWVPFLFILLMLLALSVGTLFASLSIIYRDIRNMMPYFLQLLLFLTPIVYPSEAIPEKWFWLIRINPLTGIVNSFRAIIQGESPIWSEISVSFAVTAAIFIFSLITFVKMERHVADYL